MIELKSNDHCWYSNNIIILFNIIKQNCLEPEKPDGNNPNPHNL